MNKLINFLAIIVFISTHALADDPDGFLKKMKKHHYSKDAEWINDKTFLVILKREVDGIHINSAVNGICKYTKKYSLKGIEVQVAHEKDKILKTKKCK